MDASVTEPVAESAAPAARRGAWRRLRRNMAVRIGGTVLVLLALASLFAPWLGTVDPTLLDPANRDLLPGTSGEITSLDGKSVAHTFWMGTDSYGRDIYSRVLYGGRVSLVVGVTVAALSLAIGLVIGLAAGYVRSLDSVVMRVMDGLMAIPGILIAIAVVALWRASLLTVIVAITIPDIPRVTRLVRSLVLSIREEPYVEAAVSVGTSTFKLLYRHVFPNTLAPLIVQGTYICALAILVEAVLSFLGVGLPADVPTWGNIMAEGRLQFNQYPAQRVLSRALPGVYGARREHARRWAARHSRSALQQARGPAGMNRPVLRLEGFERAAAGRRRPPLCVSQVSLEVPRGGSRVPAGRVRLRQIHDRADCDGIARLEYPRERAVASCSMARTCSLPRRSGCASCAARRWR